jgi:hypothetical protein
MKNQLLSALICLTTIPAGFAQITLSDADLPHANDTFRLSLAQPAAGIDLSLSGPNHVWDFSFLLPLSQRVDSFVDEGSTNPLFSVVFIDFPINSNRANQATPSADFNLGATVSLSDVYNFYYNSSASYKQVGLGAAVNGIPVPITFSPHDIEYRFPLQYGNVDSSASGYSVDLTSTLGIYYKVNMMRVNYVDGWGSLTTPLGTFDVLRVHSIVTQEDSIYLDTLGTGIGFPAITRHEYKWLGAGQGLPLLQANTTGTGIITQILYRDIRRSLVGIESNDLSRERVIVYPNPNKGEIILDLMLEKSSMLSADLYSFDGRLVYSGNVQQLTAGEHSLKLDLRSKDLASGKYLLKVNTDGKPGYRVLIVE